MSGMDDFLNLFADPRAVAAMQEKEAQLATAKQLQQLISGNQQPFEAELFPGESPIQGLSTGTPGKLPASASRDFISQLLGSGSQQFAGRGIGLAEKAMERVRQGQELKTAMQGSKGLESQLQSTAQIPERFAQSISNLRQLQTATPKPDFTNVQVDDTGQAHGFSVKNRQFEAIPQKDLLTKFKTVQGTGPQGLPETQLVRTSAFADKDRITVPKGMTPEAAAKKTLIDSGLSAIKDFKGLMFKNGTIDRTLIASMNTPGGGVPGSVGRTANVLLLESIEAKLRAESGAAVPQEEVERAASRFRPSLLDGNETVRTKIKLLDRFLKGTSKAIKGKSKDTSKKPTKPVSKELEALRKKHGF